jgi:hypothetical protein
MTTGTYDSGWLDLSQADTWDNYFLTTLAIGTPESAEGLLTEWLAVGPPFNYVALEPSNSLHGGIVGFLTATPEPTTSVLLLAALGLLAVREYRGHRRTAYGGADIRAPACRP